MEGQKHIHKSQCMSNIGALMYGPSSDVWTILLCMNWLIHTSEGPYIRTLSIHRNGSYQLLTRATLRCMDWFIHCPYISELQCMVAEVPSDGHRCGCFSGCRCAALWIRSTLPYYMDGLWKGSRMPLTSTNSGNTTKYTIGDLLQFFIEQLKVD